MTVIDGALDTVISTIPAGTRPFAIVFNPTNNKVYCANWLSNNVTAIDGATNNVIATIMVGSQPWTLVHNNINNKIYCANYNSDNVTIIDGTTNSVITTIAVGDAPLAFTWNPFQNRTYVANHMNSSVSVIRDSLTGIRESGVVSIVRTYLAPTISCGPLQLPEGKKYKVFDIVGRVAESEEMQRGIYFIEVDGVVTQKVIKVR